MRKLAVACVAIALSLFLCACSSAPDVEVSCGDFYKTQNIERELQVAAGKSVKVALCSNPSTGYGWGEAAISDPGVLAKVGHAYDAREGRKPPAPGTPGLEVWTLKALQPGQSTLSVEYGQPWEGGTKAEWTFVLTVVVR
ncbi:MAG TPA: protease inhibitor I42 family protein [Anaerolineae bacterium]|jgi:predicted secreted protein|nr:protease inhibitor I42 family protein [Anaerolineae bacterium]